MRRLLLVLSILLPLSAADPVRIRVVASNLTSGSAQSYDPGHGARILRGLKPDIALMQEFNIGDNSEQAVRRFVSDTFGIPELINANQVIDADPFDTALSDFNTSFSDARTSFSSLFDANMSGFGSRLSTLRSGFGDQLSTLNTTLSDRLATTPSLRAIRPRLARLDSDFGASVNRLNALVVEAKPADLDTIEQLLRVLDQPTSPEEIEVDAPPRLIPVYNMAASQVAAVVQQVYQDRVRSTGGGQQQPSPEDIIRLLRGGRGGQASPPPSARRRSETRPTREPRREYAGRPPRRSAETSRAAARRCIRRSRR